jgi:hypothetical protein
MSPGTPNRSADDWEQREQKEAINKKYHSPAGENPVPKEALDAFRSLPLTEKNFGQLRIT